MSNGRNFGATRAALVLAAIFSGALVHSRLLRAPNDDAYICFVYARNWLEGNGLTYNGAVVEGCTSFSWLVLVSGFGMLGLDPPLAGEFLSSASGLLVLLATYWLGRVLELGAFGALLPVLLVAASGDFAFYLSAGMEQPLFSALATACVAIVLSPNLRAAIAAKSLSLLIALMILTRPEGLLIAGLLCTYAILALGSWRPLLPVLRRLALFLLPVLALKWAYYGYPVPNTFYAKGNAGLANLPHGLRYLGAGLPRFAPLLILFLPALFLGFDRRRLREPLLLFSLGTIWVATIAVLGGDNLVGARVLLPALPWFSVALVRLAVPANAGSEGLPTAATLATVVASGVLLFGFWKAEPVHDHIERWRRNYPVRQALGLHLRANFPPKTLVAVEAAGIIPYYSTLPTLDLLGLNDVHIAHRGQRDFSLAFGHQASDPSYVLSREPAVILFGASARLRPNAGFASLPEFRESYRRAEWPGLGFAFVRQARAGPR